MHQVSLRTLLLSCYLVCGCSEGAAPARPVVSVSEGLTRTLAGAERVPVIVSLREPAALASQDRLQRKRSLAALQERVLSRSGADFQLLHQYRQIAALSGNITAGALAQLQADPEVSEIHTLVSGGGALAEALPAIAADTVQRVFKLTGRGMRVAVLDTGVDSEHPDLRGAVVAQHCFTSGGCGPFRSNEGESAQDDNGHGTSVASVIASRGRVAPLGFAPEAEIVAVKVQGADNRGTSNNWVAGLDWVYDNLEQLSVDVVLVSFGTELLFEGMNCESAVPAMNRTIQNLVRAGVPVVASSGNAGSQMLLPLPACDSDVVAVGASYDSALGAQPPGGGSYAMQLGVTFAACRDEDTSATTLACFSNGGAKLDLLAPGAPILGSTLEGQARQTYGTSNSAAVVAAVMALVRQCNPRLRPAELRDLLKRTGTRSVSGSGRPTYPIVHAQRAVEAACPDVVGAAAGGASGGAAMSGNAGGASPGSAGAAAPLAGATGAQQPAVQGGGPGTPGSSTSRGVAGAGGANGALGNTSSAVSAAGSGGANRGLPPAEAEGADSGAPRAISWKPPAPVRGSLPAEPKSDSGGCSITGSANRSGAVWSLLALCALMRRSVRAQRRTNRPSHSGGQK